MLLGARPGEDHVLQASPSRLRLQAPTLLAVADQQPGDPGVVARPLDGVELSAGSPGSPADIAVDGQMVSPGYWGEPDREGPFETRDVGYLDEGGRLHVIGRSDDVIISGGENIHPAEVEAVLGSLDAVQAAAAFGVSDDVWGERLEAAVVLFDETATVESIEAAVRESLPDFKIPKHLHIVPELPLGPTGKIDRRGLVELAMSVDDPERETGNG